MAYDRKKNPPNPKGGPLKYEVRKSCQLRMALTPKAKQWLRDKADEMGVTMTDLIELWAREDSNNAA